jgi:hypothetical protein
MIRQRLVIDTNALVSHLMVPGSFQIAPCVSR